MIEKFSDEELKQIKRELGIIEKTTKVKACSKEYGELHKLFEKIPNNLFIRLESSLFNLIDIVLCNYKETQTGCYMNKFLEEKDVKEYRQMFQEIFEIIKRHNRKWEGNNQ